jgi:peroxiredoxin
MQEALVPASKKPVFLIAGIVLAIVIAVLAWFSVSSAKAAPRLTFKSITGETISPASLKGKVVMVNFWATSCETCVREMPKMVETYNKYKAEGLEFIAVAMSYDQPNYVVNFAETRQLPFKVALDLKSEIANAYGDVKLTPTTFVIGKDGNIIKRYVGEPEFGSLHALLEKAFKA